MQAGPELNVLVAEKVMGWNLRSDRWYDGERETLWRTDASYFRGDWEFWNPSQDIVAAQEVMEKLKEYHWNIEWSPVMKVWETEPWPSIGWHENEFFVRADTLPLAICRAALKVKGIET